MNLKPTQPLTSTPAMSAHARMHCHTTGLASLGQARQSMQQAQIEHADCAGMYVIGLHPGLCRIWSCSLGAGQSTSLAGVCCHARARHALHMTCDCSNSATYLAGHTGTHQAAVTRCRHCTHEPLSVASAPQRALHKCHKAGACAAGMLHQV